MSSRRHRPRIVLVTMLAVASVVPSACSAKNCADVGAASSLDLTFDAGVLTTVQPVAVTACVDDHCQSRTLTRELSPVVRMTVPSIKADAAVTVLVKATSGSRVVFAGSTHTTTVKYQPNGPGCEPTVWDVSVAAHRGGRLSG